MRLEEETRAHERRQEEADQEFARRKDWLAFRAFIAVMTLIAAFSLLGLILPWSSDDSRKWATLSLTTILSLCAGYLVGKTQK